MDKYDQRKFHAKKLAKERYSSLFFFFVIVFCSTGYFSLGFISQLLLCFCLIFYLRFFLFT